MYLWVCLSAHGEAERLCVGVRGHALARLPKRVKLPQPFWFSATTYSLYTSEKCLCTVGLPSIHPSFVLH